MGNYNNIIGWIMSLDNGRFLKYRNVLKVEMSKVALTGIGLKSVQNADLLMYGIGDFQDQMRLVHHIDALTGRKQKKVLPGQPIAAYNIGPGGIGPSGSDEGMEGNQTADIK